MGLRQGTSSVGCKHVIRINKQSVAKPGLYKM